MYLNTVKLANKKRISVVKRNHKILFEHKIIREGNSLISGNIPIKVIEY